MGEHILRCEQIIARPLAEVFEFFSKASNLERITPAELNFHILTPQPIVLSEGKLIDYRIRLYGIPITWRTEITVWDPPNEFVDTQLSGPYAQWIHRHSFRAISKNETLMEDEVRYRLPLAPLGDIGHFFVRRQLEHIFRHREAVISEIFKRDQPGHSPK